MKIYVISLTRAVERRKSIEKQFSELGIDFEFIDAVDGLKMSVHDVRYAAVEAFYIEYATKPWITEGVVAAALSHKIAYQRIRDEKLDYGMVLEDDVILSPDFPRLLEEVRQHLDPMRVITFFFQSYSKKSVLQLKKDNKIQLQGEYAMYEPVSIEGCGSAAAYIISGYTANRLFNCQNPVRFCPDWWIAFRNNEAFHEMRLVFPLALKPGEFESSINYMNDNSMLSRIRDVLVRIPLLRRFVDRQRKDRFELFKQYEFV